MATLEFGELAYPAIVSVIAVMVYQSMAVAVGQARRKYKVPIPQQHGPTNFNKVIRVHLNTAEQFVPFVYEKEIN
jgi:hypothetical protein